MTTLIDALQNMQRTSYPLEKEWILYLKDRRTHLLKTATVVGIESKDVYRYKYNLHRYLKDHDYPVDLWWAVLWINNLKSEDDFENVEALTIPDQGEINKLLVSYKSYMAKYKSQVLSVV